MLISFHLQKEDNSIDIVELKCKTKKGAKQWLKDNYKPQRPIVDMLKWTGAYWESYNKV